MKSEVPKRRDRYFHGIDYAVLNVLEERKRTTAEIEKILSGYEPYMVVESVRRLKSFDYIRKHSSNTSHHAVWEVIV